MKNAGSDYHAYAAKIGEVVRKAQKHKMEENKHLVEGLESTMNHVQKARAGDHGAHLVNSADKTLGKQNNIGIVWRDLGEDPVALKRRRTVNWEATYHAAK